MITFRSFCTLHLAFLVTPRNPQPYNGYHLTSQDVPFNCYAKDLFVFPFVLTTG